MRASRLYLIWPVLTPDPAHSEWPLSRCDAIESRARHQAGGTRHDALGAKPCLSFGFLPGTSASRGPRRMVAAFAPGLKGGRAAAVTKGPLLFTERERTKTSRGNMPSNSQFDFGSAGRVVRRWLLSLALIVVIIVVALTALTRIDPAHVGIRVKLAGSNRGVQDMPVVTGWVFYNPLTEQIIEFPTSIQNIVWAQSVHEGAAHDESITFSSSEGANVNADIGLSFSIEPSKVPHLYLRFRKTDLMELANGYVRNALREAFSDVASRMPIQRIYGAGKHELVVDVTRKLNDVLAPDGFVIAQLTINGTLRLPESFVQSINQSLEATQNSIRTENRTRQFKAEAEQAKVQAEGLKEAAMQRAEGEANAILIRARADATANEIIRLSATGAVLQWRALERWDGKLPMMQSGDKLPMLTFDVRGLAGSDATREKRLHELLDEIARKTGDKGKGESPAAPPPAKPADPKADAKPADAPAAAAQDKPAQDKPAE